MIPFGAAARAAIFTGPTVAQAIPVITSKIATMGAKSLGQKTSVKKTPRGGILSRIMGKPISQSSPAQPMREFRSLPPPMLQLRTNGLQLSSNSSGPPGPPRPPSLPKFEEPH